MALRGNLKDFSLPDVFQLVTFSRKTGVLRIERGDGAEGSVWFREGEVFFAQSNWNHELLGSRLVRGQRITPQALERAVEMRAQEPEGGRRLGAILVDEGYITDRVLESFVQEQIQDTIFDLMRWEDGEFDFEAMPDAVEEDIGLSVSIENIIMEGSRRLEEWNRIRKKIPSTDIVFKMATAPGEGTFEISLKPIEWSLLLLVDGTRSVADLAVETSRTDFEVARILYGLFSAGLLEFASDEEIGRLRAERVELDAKRAAAEARLRAEEQEKLAAESEAAIAVEEEIAVAEAAATVEAGADAAEPEAEIAVPGPETAPEPAAKGRKKKASRAAAPPEEPAFLGSKQPAEEDMQIFEEMMTLLQPAEPVERPAPAPSAEVDVSVEAAPPEEVPTEIVAPEEPLPPEIESISPPERTVVAEKAPAEKAGPEASTQQKGVPEAEPTTPAGEVAETPSPFEFDLSELGDLLSYERLQGMTIAPEEAASEPTIIQLEPVRDEAAAESQPVEEIIFELKPVPPVEISEPQAEAPAPSVEITVPTEKGPGGEPEPEPPAAVAEQPQAEAVPAEAAAVETPAEAQPEPEVVLESVEVVEELEIEEAEAVEVEAAEAPEPEPAEALEPQPEPAPEPQTEPEPAAPVAEPPEAEAVPAEAEQVEAAVEPEPTAEEPAELEPEIEYVLEEPELELEVPDLAALVPEVVKPEAEVASEVSADLEVDFADLGLDVLAAEQEPEYEDVVEPMSMQSVPLVEITPAEAIGTEPAISMMAPADAGSEEDALMEATSIDAPDFVTIMDSLDEQLGEPSAPAVEAGFDAELLVDDQSPTAGVISTSGYLEDIGAEGLSLTSGLGDELSALTGAERHRSARPTASVNHIPEPGQTKIGLDRRVDKDTLLKIIDGIKNL